MNKPASLTAGVCSLCITATMVAVPPHAAAADLPVIQHRSVSVSDQPYELTAASVALQNLLLVAGIPFNNLNTTLTTLGGLTNFVTGLNQALGNIYKGNWNLVPANLQKAWTDEVAAFQKVLQLPQTLINYNVRALQNLFGGVAPASVTSTFVTSERVHTLALPSAAPAIEGSTTESADELTVIDVKDSAGNAEALSGSEVESSTELAVDADTTAPEDDTEADSADTVDEVDPTVPAADTTVEAPTEDAPEESSEPAAEKPAPADTDQATDVHDTADADTPDAGATYGKHALKGGTAGKHARPDDATDSTASSSTAGSSTDSAPGRHRKAESGAEGSSSSSAGKSGAAA